MLLSAPLARAGGHVAERLRSGLQIRVLRFDSGRGLHRARSCPKPVKRRILKLQPLNLGAVGVGARHTISLVSGWASPTGEN